MTCETVIKLKQETPYIHFQHYEKGATLRATEVKPKLDKFLVEKLGGEANINKEWFVKSENNKKALNYKLKFAVQGINTVSQAGNEICKAIDGNIRSEDERKKHANCSRDAINGMYFANMVNGTNYKRPLVGNDLEEKQKEIKKAYKETVFAARNITMSVVCFIPELMEEICKYVQEFFVVENFGSRQSKGFGGYSVKSIGDKQVNLSEKQIADALCEKYGAAKCYKFAGGINNVETLERIRIIYSIIKSGANYGYTKPKLYRRSLLFVYLKDKEKFNNGRGIGNEKAFLKQKGMAPIKVTRTDNVNNGYYRNQRDEDYRYTRALLGVGDNMFGPKRDEKVSIAETSKNIERYPSTLFFKVVGNTVYYVGKRISEDVLGASFKFSSSYQNNRQSKTLNVPSENDGVDENFMDDFLEYCKKELNNPNPREGDSLVQFFKVLFRNNNIKIEIKEACANGQ
ncbi:MAG: hypothetical protein IKJ59_03145 [Clostridia bacterium]|nr:hypothetical protein [Clostridia bacterium]